MSSGSGAKALEQSDPDGFLLAGRYTLLDHADALRKLMPASQARGGTPAPVIPAADPGAASVQPLYSDNPATTTPLDAAPVQPVRP